MDVVKMSFALKQVTQRKVLLTGLVLAVGAATVWLTFRSVHESPRGDFNKTPRAETKVAINLSSKQALPGSKSKENTIAAGATRASANDHDQQQISEVMAIFGPIVDRRYKNDEPGRQTVMAYLAGFLISEYEGQIPTTTVEHGTAAADSAESVRLPKLDDQDLAYAEELYHLRSHAHAYHTHHIAEVLSSAGQKLNTDEEFQILRSMGTAYPNESQVRWWGSWRIHQKQHHLDVTKQDQRFLESVERIAGSGTAVVMKEMLAAMDKPFVSTPPHVEQPAELD